MIGRILLFTSLLFSSMAFAETGFRHITLNGDRPLEVALWYPASSAGTLTPVGENAAFYGEAVLPDAAPTSTPHPLLLLSHGYGGNWRNLNWLARAMAAQGYVVAAPNHPGTTTENRAAQDAQQLWRRSQDLNQVLDAVLKNSHWAGEIDPSRIAAVGHSLGGWTVMQLAGARFSASAFMRDCQNHPYFSDCQLVDTLGIADRKNSALLEADRREPRIKAVVSLDLGLARGFTPASLAAINLPVLVLSAQEDSPELPASLESGYLAQHIAPRWVDFQRVKGATHFSFMQRCKPDATVLIEKHSPGDGIICRDEGDLSRSAIHQAVLDRIIPFLAQALARPAGETRSASSR